METEPARRAISKGICTFCKAELAKNKMTQHLKFCKQRQASIASQEEQSQETKTRLFHILAEGQYSPQYWLHFEVPAHASLWSLDGFIKKMWIDDLDHLSGFEINGTSYRDNYSYEIAPFVGVEETEETEEEEICVRLLLSVSGSCFGVTQWAYLWWFSCASDQGALLAALA